MKQFACGRCVEGSLTPAAIALGGCLARPPLATVILTSVGRDALWALPHAAAAWLFWLCLVCPWRPLAEHRQNHRGKLLVPYVSRLPARATGDYRRAGRVGEETLFRGVVQAAAAQQIAAPTGVLARPACGRRSCSGCSIPYAVYAILAGLVGPISGGLWLACGNLLTPDRSHTACTHFLRLVYVENKGKGREERGEG